MGFDPVSYLMGKASGGGGGGDGNAYALPTAPDASVGSDGEYYFELLNSSYISGLNSNPTMQANTSTAGWEFTANENITIVGARGLSRSSYTGTIKLATSDGTVLAEKSVQLSNAWESIYFDSPVALTSGSNYIIMLFGNYNTLMYQQSPSTAAKITYVCGRYEGLPGTSESGTAYSVDILIANDAPPPYQVKKQYYKAGGVWVPV